MCTRYFMDDAPRQLADIIMTARNSRLTNKMINKFSRPLVTVGEVRPTDIVPVIAPNTKGERAIYPMRWGFQNPHHNSILFNARTETAGTKPTFQEAWQSHRCVIPASYYFEWQHFKSPDGKEKTGAKYAIQPYDSEFTWLCGLYRIEDGIPYFVILTREPGPHLAEIHDRMPLILPPERINEWIMPTTDPNTLLPYALTDMIIEKQFKDSSS